MKKLAISLLAVAACAADDPNGPGGGDDAPAFTEGVSTLSGAAEAAWEDGPRGVARFNNPVNVLYGPDGKLYVADFDNSKVRTVDPATGETETLVTQPNFRRPFAMTFGADGKLYVTTDCNSTSGSQGPMTGTIWRVENGEAVVVAENMGRPRGIATLPNGKLAISDYQHHVIQLVDPVSGTGNVLAGTWDNAGMVDGSISKFSTPYGMAVDGDSLVVADYDNHRIRRIELDGTVTTLAGTGSPGFSDGAGEAAAMNKPQGVTVANGTVYFTDLGNYRVRKIAADGSVSTVAGTGEGGFADNDDPLAAQLFGLEGLTSKPDGSFVYVADGTRGESAPYNRVRMIEIH